MTHRHILAALALGTLATSAAAQGEIGTLQRGHYTCELPGNAASDAGVEQTKESFSILSASRYRSSDGRGTYLRQGNRLTMTSGPRNGDSYIIVSENFLRKLEADGKPGRLRCVRSGG